MTPTPGSGFPCQYGYLLPMHDSMHDACDAVWGYLIPALALRKSSPRCDSHEQHSELTIALPGFCAWIVLADAVPMPPCEKPLTST